MKSRKMSVNNPIPSDLAAECKKASKVLNSFIKPTSSGLDSVIPSDIISSAKGLAILTVVKAGFLWSGRMGSGIVVARLPDGSWSPPSGIGTAGVGFGGQIGAEITDFVIILNTLDAVKAFSMGGNVTLGGNLSVAAGPIGRTAEAGGTIGKFAAIFSYSKTKGLFAGVSLEGSVIIERKDANADFYKRKISAKEILSGSVERPAAAQNLYQALELRSGVSSPISPRGEDQLPPYHQPQYQQQQFGVRTAAPSIPPRPTMNSQSSSDVFVIALYDFKGERGDDLSFSKGDMIKIIRKTSSQNDWWLGERNGKQGNFPANYTRPQ